MIINLENKPTGFVTFLFTDIEGSTRLAQEFPENLQQSLDRHHSIMNDAIGSNNGFVFEIVGDAFCAAFQEPLDAVKAAVKAQRELAREDWKEAVIKSRIGIHTGNAEWNNNRYMGYITLARTARVMSSAYGEQILISKDVYELCSLSDDTGISFRDLGERRLKDLIQPIRLYQIISEGLQENFPPLKTLDARPNNLPIQLTSFIGRNEEIKEIKELMKEARLLTLAGAGGAGKTRLALQVAADMIDDYPNGVWIVELASLLEHEYLPNAVTGALGILEQPGKKIEDALIDHLKDKEILLLFDNCEHLVHSVSLLAEKILTSCPKVSILSTSREALRCDGEQTHKIMSLAFPKPDSQETAEQLTQYESVRLFIERALSVNRQFRVNSENAQSLAQICYRLDGIPLAIELAAARMKAMSVEQVQNRLNNRFQLLTGGKRTSLPRQQTLKALIDWSYDLLSENEATLCNRLSVFSGGWTLDAAEEICSDERIDRMNVVDLLTDLSEKSLIIFDEEKVRYRMLETIKQYGDDRLREANENNSISDIHMRYFEKVAMKADKDLFSPDSANVMRFFDDEISNLERAYLHALEKHDLETAVNISISIVEYRKLGGQFSEGIEWLEKVYEHKSDLSEHKLNELILKIGSIAQLKAEFDKAKEFVSMSLEFSRKTGDKSGIAAGLIILGRIASLQGDSAKALDIMTEALACSRETGDKKSIAASLLNIGMIKTEHADYSGVLELYEESRQIYSEIGYKLGMSQALACLGNIAYETKDYQHSFKMMNESLLISREIGDKRNIAYTLFNIAACSDELGDRTNSMKLTMECQKIFGEIGDRRGMALALANLGVMEHGLEQYDAAIEHYTQGIAISKDIGFKFLTAVLAYSLGRTYFIKEEYDLCLKNYKESLAICKELNNKKHTVLNLTGISELFSIRGREADGAKLLGFVDKFQKLNDIVMLGLEKDFFDKVYSEVYSGLAVHLGPDSFDRIFEEGRSITLEKAMDIAFS